MNYHEKKGYWVEVSTNFMTPQIVLILADTAAEACQLAHEYSADLSTLYYDELEINIKFLRKADDVIIKQES